MSHRSITVSTSTRDNANCANSRLLKLVIASALLLQAYAASSETRTSLPAEYERLLAGGCQPEQFDVATPLEARVLRNLPFARAGQWLDSIDLAELYASDGDWYRPEHDRVELSEADGACVVRLRLHERSLRKQLPLGGDVEAVITRDLGVFWSLRRHTRYPNAYRDARGSIQGGQWSWGFVDGATCGGDGSPEAADDCAGFTVICTADEDGQKPTCELVMSG